MSLIKWEPMRDIEDIFDRYTRSIVLPSNPGQDFLEKCDWSPRVDISETDKAFIIRAEIPDVQRDDVKVSVDDGVLTIHGERQKQTEEEGEKFHRVERSYGSFVRSFALPDNVDETKIDAVFKEGMLNLKLLKTEAHKPKKIDVKVH